MHPGWLAHKWTALSTSVNDPRETFETHSLKPLAKVITKAGIWPHIICNINDNASWFILAKNLTGKYAVNAGRGGCFGDRVDQTVKRNTGGHDWNEESIEGMLQV